jgi:hypothetical protein
MLWTVELRKGRVVGGIVCTERRNGVLDISVDDATGSAHRGRPSHAQNTTPVTRQPRYLCVRIGRIYFLARTKISNLSAQVCRHGVFLHGVVVLQS